MVGTPLSTCLCAVEVMGYCGVTIIQGDVTQHQFSSLVQSKNFSIRQIRKRMHSQNSSRIHLFFYFSRPQFVKGVYYTLSEERAKVGYGPIHLPFVSQSDL